MKQQDIVCVDPNVYTDGQEGVSFAEARAVMLAKYFEKEAGVDLEKKIRLHLDRCACCTLFLKDLEEAGSDKVVSAVCPSSQALDRYLFDRKELPAAEVERIERHLAECPICLQETDWLKNVEQEKIIEFRPGRGNLFRSISIAAAMCLVVLTGILWWQTFHSRVPSEKLAALAVVKQPNELDYASLDQTSKQLSAEWRPVYEEAKVLLKERKFDDVAERLEKILRAQPDHSASLFLLGYTYYYLDEPEKAFALCDRAEQMHPHSLERCLSLVNIALKTGHFGRAVKEINGLYHQAPDVPEIREMYERITALTRGRTLKL